MAQAAPAEVIDRIARALRHPLRVRILAELAGGRGSASSLSKQLGVPLGNVNYHLGVLHLECGVLQLAGTRQVRGVQETFFRIEPALLQDFVVAAIEALGFEPEDVIGAIVAAAGPGTPAREIERG